MLAIEFDPKSLFPVLERTKSQALRWANMAGSSALRAMKAEASRQIRARKGLKTKYVSRALSTIFPRPGDLPAWTLRASGTPLPLIAFGARQNRKGVSVLQTKGNRTVIPGAFIATMPRSGHTGVFERTGSYGRKPTNPKVRIPKSGPGLETIRELKGSSIGDSFKEVAPEVAAKGRQVFLRTFARLAAGGGRKVASWETEGEHD